MRELCAGVNVDLGTAAAFREQWAREAEEITGKPHSPVKLLLKTDQAPGDAVAMTAAIYSLHKSYPNKYITSVESYWPDVFEHNPNISEHLIPTGEQNRLPDALDVQMHYPAIHQSNDRGIHFMQGWCEFLGMALGISIPLLTNTPKLYFETPDPPVNNFWVVCSGGKNDFTTKLWGHRNYQEVIRILGRKVNFVQVGGAKPIIEWNRATMGSQKDYHQPLEGAASMLGKTTLRELFELVRRSRGVLCGVSLLMHVAAALDKPAIVIAGGREPVQWNSYPKQQYLHTIGVLPCRDIKGRTGVGCWRYRTLPIGDGTLMDKSLCERPVGNAPECLHMITPQEVAELVLRYNHQYGYPAYSK